jgi:hypothetical protein
MPEPGDTDVMARRRSEEEIEQVLEHYRASGLTQMEYCRQTGMVLSTLGRYLRRRNRAEQHLVKVELESAAEAKTGFAGFALVLGNGRRIESGWGFGDAELVRLIHIAESV